jgi:hypothetical protein
MPPEQYMKEIFEFFGLPGGQPVIILDPDVRVEFSAQSMRDMSPEFLGLGLFQVQMPRLTLPRPASPGTLSKERPSTFKAELHALGEPSRYPFDKYILMGGIVGDAYIGYKGQYTRLKGATYDMTFRLPGFVVKQPPAQLLQDWPTGLRGITELMRSVGAFPKNVSMYSVPFDAERWKDGQFIVLLERPSFLRVSTVFLGVLALLSIFVGAYFIEPKQFVMNALGYFVALWAIRSVLGAGAPAGVPTYLDYGVVTLYFIEISALAVRVTFRRQQG